MQLKWQHDNIGWVQGGDQGENVSWNMLYSSTAEYDAYEGNSSLGSGSRETHFLFLNDRWAGAAISYADWSILIYKSLNILI